MGTALPNVTLVMLDTVERELCKAALRDTAEQIEWSFEIIDGSIFNHNYTHDMVSYDKRLWTALAKSNTTHSLIIQYDSWVLDGARWRDSWLEYDYIGAPWPWHADRRVGNGGFSLRSTRLMEFLSKNKADFPVRWPEDDVLCRIYRPALELSGFKWAPEDVAREFSFEREAPHLTFGFHGIFNWPHVLTPAQLAERIRFATDYAKSKSEWRELMAA